MGKKLYVGNLSYQATEDDLKDLFKEFGTVAGVSVVTDRVTGKSRGFGFVEFTSSQEADKAISSVNKKRFKERELVVNEARPRKERRSRR